MNDKSERLLTLEESAEILGTGIRFARRLISLRWKDAASDGHVYHLQALLDRLVPGMSQKDRVELIRICHSELVRHPELAGGGRTKQNTPASLQPYVQW